MAASVSQPEPTLQPRQVAADQAGRAPVVFAGTLPPPVTGMTAMTAVVVDELRRRGAVRIINWSPGKPMKGWRWKIRRGAGALKTLLLLPLCGLGHGRRFYYPVSSGGGLYYDLAIVAWARLLGYRPALHHHAYSYIDRRDWRVACLDRLSGASGAHVVHAPPMIDDFRRSYPEVRGAFWIVPPTIAAPPEPVNGPLPECLRTLGLMSNLTFAKGLQEAIDTFERLAVKHSDLRLVLAGPCMGADESAVIEQTVSRWAGRVQYRGPVYDEAKADFFRDIDLFLFPTKYRNESWGIVLSEALAFGRPVIAANRGCVPWIVASGCGVVVDRAAEFSANAVRQIEHWIVQPDEFRDACARARDRTVQLSADAQRELPRLIDRMIDRESPRGPSQHAEP